MDLKNHPRFLELQEVAILHGNTLSATEYDVVIYDRGHGFSKQTTHFVSNVDEMNEDEMNDLLDRVERSVNDPRTHSK